MRTTLPLILFLLLTQALRAETYYLDLKSTATDPDGSQSHPWTTLEQMQTTLAGKPGGGSGDVVRIAPGEYGNYIEGVAPNDTAAAPFQRALPLRTEWLKLEAADPSQPPVFDFIQLYGNKNAWLRFEGITVRSKPPHRPWAVYLRSVAKVHFSKCKIFAEDDGTEWPDGVGGGAEDLTFENCEVSHVTAALSVGGKNLTIRNCHIHDIASSALKIGEGSSQVLLEGNYIHHQSPRIVRLFLYGEVKGSLKKGSKVVQDETGAKGEVYTVSKDKIEVTPESTIKILFALGKPVRLADGGDGVDSLTKVIPSDLSHGSGLSIRSSDLIARNNVIHNFGSTAAVTLYPDKKKGLSYHDIVLENNLIFDPLTRHMVLDGLGDNIVIRHNTLPHGDIQLYAAEGKDLSGVTVENNIFTGITVMKAGDIPTLKASNNILFWVLSREPRKSFTSYEGYPGSLFLHSAETGQQAFTDLFVNFAEKDFRLKPGSRAVDRAKPDASPSTDLTGFARDSHADIGCFEEGAKAVPLTPPLGPTEKVDRAEAFAIPSYR